MHETRNGGLARLGEVPFRLYYGTVDATPLFVMLAGMYFDRTGDIGTIAAIWPNIKAALIWIDTFGDADGDGFVEYMRQTESGLINQGWKNSSISIFHANGALASGPIALCEVQGYVFAAKTQAAKLAHRMGQYDLEIKLHREAQVLRKNFEAACWCEDIGTFALALDGNKTPCRVRTSNAGHTLFTGIALPGRAVRVAETLLGPDSFSGWGIRTVASGEARFNPISYHNGSIWPHDNAMIALGFARYGFVSHTTQSLLRNVRSCGLSGFAPLAGIILRLYPQVTPRTNPLSRCLCAASLGLGRGFCLPRGLSWHGAALRCQFRVFSRSGDAALLDFVILSQVSLGHSRIDLKLKRHGEDVTLNLLRRMGNARAMLVK